jgi:glycosyltransferase involved in cell wall biosynthesis
MLGCMGISIVIPVFNEERHIRGCLEAIARQSVMPNEVIVVDNNSTDKTGDIAREFSFVRVVHESQQGRGYARSKGFNEAKHEIIGRIDADSRIAPDWVERVLAAFSADPELSGVTGPGKTSFIPLVEGWRTTLFARGYFWHVHAGFKTITMWGANMAIRKSAWQAAAPVACLDDELVHEDQDVSLCMAAQGHRIIQDDDLLVVADGQEFLSVSKALRYRKLYIKTRRRHATFIKSLKDERSFRLQATETLLGFLIIYVLGGVVLLLHSIIFPFSKIGRRS